MYGLLYMSERRINLEKAHKWDKKNSNPDNLRILINFTLTKNDWLPTVTDEMISLQILYTLENCPQSWMSDRELNWIP